MKTIRFAKPVLAAVAGLALLAGNTMAQNSTTAAAPQLSYGVPQIIQLSQAKVGDNTIINYIHNAGYAYGLDADQIIYMHQQGVSDDVINTMLSVPKTAAAAPAPPAAQPQASSAAPAFTTDVQPATTYVQTVPSSTVYVIPDTQTYYYNTHYYAQPYYYPYPSYSYVNPFPVVGFSFGFGGGYHGGGWHGGGGFHGGGHR